MVSSTFITDTADSLDSWINEGAQKLHDMLVQAYGNDYVEKAAALTTVAGTSDYALPTDFYKLLGVGLPFGGQMRTLKPFEQAERNAYKNQPTSLSRFNIPRYRLAGAYVRLYPAPNAAMTGEIIYAPLLQVTLANATISNLLVSGTDSVNFPNGWERFVIMWAARVAKAKQEDDVSQLNRDIAKEEADLTSIIESRNAAQPHSAVDMEATEYDPWEF